MKNIIYLKTKDNKVIKHDSIEHKIENIAYSYDNSLNDILWKISSRTWSLEELNNYFSYFGNVINIIDAHILAEQLLPNRNVQEGDRVYHYNKYELINDLSLAKEYAKQIIDKKTVSKFDDGYEFDSIIFSLSDNAQKNWMTLRTQKDNGTIPNNADFTTIPTKAGNPYNIRNDKIELFTNGIWTHIQNIVNAGSLVKTKINNSSNIYTIKSIIDNYK